MTKKEAAKIVRQRIKPNIFDFCFITTRSHLKAFRNFRHRLKSDFERPLTLLDLGCGYKPFKGLLTNVAIQKYTGVDFDTTRSAADIVAPVDDLPLDDHSFDAIIASEVFEHTLNLDKAINELRRVAKNGALVYISTPFMFPEHGTPFDFQRMTRYKYQDLFRHDEILSITPTNSSLATPFLLFNVCWENITLLKMIPVLAQLVYLWNNLWALLAEGLVRIAGAFGTVVFWKKKDWFQKIFKIYFSTMPGGYDVIVRINK